MLQIFKVNSCPLVTYSAYLPRRRDVKGVITRREGLFKEGGTDTMQCLISAKMTGEKCFSLRYHTPICRSCPVRSGKGLTRALMLEIPTADYEVLVQTSKVDGHNLEDDIKLLICEMAENARHKAA